MGTAIDPVLISRLSGEFETLGNQMWALGRGRVGFSGQVAGGRAGKPARETVDEHSLDRPAETTSVARSAKPITSTVVKSIRRATSCVARRA
ncbi:hypothetical protein, partial [Nocardia cyriacigeorgica]|uniref:hypothetical protein n=1 Tax=Nocardia cyriacigeorgica TaxID=135487 RepID=UPI00245633AC